MCRGEAECFNFGHWRGRSPPLLIVGSILVEGTKDDGLWIFFSTLHHLFKLFRPAVFVVRYKSNVV